MPTPLREIVHNAWLRGADNMLFDAGDSVASWVEANS